LAKACISLYNFTMKIVRIEEITYDEVIEVLENSGLVIYPTETCYGVGCNACDQKAVDKLFSYKARREGKAISIAVADRAMAEEYVEVNDTAAKIYERFLPGPFTVISKGKNRVAEGIQAEDGTQAIRIPDYAWIRDLVSKYRKPITATSANQSYHRTPYKVSDITENASPKALELIDLIIDAGELPHNPPSTILNTVQGDVQVLRKGQFLPENAVVEEIVSCSEADTIAFGEKMLHKYSKNLKFRPVLFALQGDLGAGKTHFTKGIAAAMSIEKQIQSPTFILAREYSSPIGNRLHHIDTWRLETMEEARELGIEEMLSEKRPYIPDVLPIAEMNPGEPVASVIVIEWADKIVEYLRDLNVNTKIIWIEIVKDQTDESKRLIRWSE
jgi:L-threonylcarbamoyladenylate synthase